MTEEFDEREIVGRRAAIKKAGAAAGVAAVVWAEPSLKGLARRPGYAAGGSGIGPVTHQVTIMGMVMGTTVMTVDSVTSMTAPAEFLGAISLAGILFQSANGPRPRIELTASGNFPTAGPPEFVPGTAAPANLLLSTPINPNTFRRIRLRANLDNGVGGPLLYTITVNITCP